MRYLVQFPAGTAPLVERGFRQVLGDVRTVYLDDSAIVFDSRKKVVHADDLPFAKNVFVVRTEVPRRDMSRSIRALARRSRVLRTSVRQPAFRLMYHIDGELVAIDPRVRSELERAVAVATDMPLSPRGSCQEFWVIGRRDLDVLLLAERLPRHTPAAKVKGALSSELATLLVLASGPRPDETFLDPFGGSGALVQASLAHPVRTVIYNDHDLTCHSSTLPPALRRDPRVRLLREDALMLPSIADGLVDIVVTDPPWGEYEAMAQPYDEFAAATSKSLARVLAANTGRLVILVNRRNADTFSGALHDHGLFVEATVDILVGGHPATVVLGGSTAS